MRLSILKSKLQLEQLKEYLRLTHERECEQLKKKLFELRDYLDGREFDDTNFDHCYKGESIYKDNCRALLMKRVRIIIENLCHCVFRLNTLNEETLYNDDMFRNMLIDLRHGSMLLRNDNCRKALDTFWATFDPKVIALLEDQVPTDQMNQLISGTYMHAVPKDQIKGFIDKLLGRSNPKGKQTQDYDIDDSLGEILNELKKD